MSKKNVSKVLVVAGIVVAGVAVSGAIALADQYSYNISINSITNSDLTLTLNGDAGGSPYNGKLDDISVGINWGDTSSTLPADNFTITASSTSPDKTFAATWNASHTYTTPGTYTVTAVVFHAQLNGNEKSSGGTVTSTIVVNPVIFASAGAGGSITPLGTTTVTYGSDQTFTITPDIFSSISSITVDGAPTTTASSYTFHDVTANHTIDAEFSSIVVLPSLTLTATTTGSGTGTITSNDSNISCGSAGSACSSTYAPASLVILTASADSPTSTFVGWSGACSGTSPTCSIPMFLSDESVTAEFDLASETLAVGTQGSGGGTVSSTPGSIFCNSANPSSTCTSVFTIGDAVTLFAAPDASSTFSNWSGGACDASTSTTCSVTIDSTTPNSTIVAVFDLIPAPTQSAVNLTIAGTGNGNVSSTPAGISCASGTCTADFTIGSTTTLTAAADASSTFSGWSGDECSGSTSTTCSFTVPSSTVSITATFDAANNGGGTPTSTPSSTVPADADLAITKTADVTSTTPGGTVNYTLTVNALGPGTSTAVTATDILPSALDFVSASASEGSYDNTTGIWSIGDLAPSSTATLVIGTTVDASTTASTTIANTATVAESASSTDSDMSNNSSTASIFVNATSTNNGGGGGGGGCTTNCGGTPSSTPSSTVDLAITNVVDNANPATSTNVNYLITVTNNGNATGTFIEMDDTWPSTAFAFVGVTTSMASTSITGTGLSWNIGTLAPNATATLALELNVGANQAGQTIANTATVTSTLASFSDPTPGNNSSTADITVQSAATSTNNGGGGGGGGGGGITVGVAGGGGGGNGGGVVLGASTTTVPTGSTAPQGMVLGASTTCGIYLTSYIKPANYKNVNNNSAQVKLLQEFLNAELGTAIPVTGYYGSLSEAAVRQFQLKYSTEVLAPWVPYGLANDKTSTGYVYKTTQRWINMIECPALALPMPQLP